MNHRIVALLEGRGMPNPVSEWPEYQDLVATLRACEFDAVSGAGVCLGFIAGIEYAREWGLEDFPPVED